MRRDRGRRRTFAGGGSPLVPALTEALQKEIRELGIVTATPDRWKEFPLLASFALPATLFSYVMIPGLWFANALLVRQPHGYIQMADYAAAQMLRIMVKWRLYRWS